MNSVLHPEFRRLFAAQCIKFILKSNKGQAVFFRNSFCYGSVISDAGVKLSPIRFGADTLEDIRLKHYYFYIGQSLSNILNKHTQQLFVPMGSYTVIVGNKMRNIVKSDKKAHIIGVYI